MKQLPSGRYFWPTSFSKYYYYYYWISFYKCVYICCYITYNIAYILCLYNIQENDCGRSVFSFFFIVSFHFDFQFCVCLCFSTTTFIYSFKRIILWIYSKKKSMNECIIKWIKMSEWMSGLNIILLLLLLVECRWWWWKKN